jgi:hypothetical protein
VKQYQDKSNNNNYNNYNCNCSDSALSAGLTCLYLPIILGSSSTSIVLNQVSTGLSRLKKRCALCGCAILFDSPVHLCSDCIGFADCCIGLEKIKD